MDFVHGCLGIKGAPAVHCCRESFLSPDISTWDASCAALAFSPTTVMVVSVESSSWRFSSSDVRGNSMRRSPDAPPDPSLMFLGTDLKVSGVLRRCLHFISFPSRAGANLHFQENFEVILMVLPSNIPRLLHTFVRCMVL